MTPRGERFSLQKNQGLVRRSGLIAVRLLRREYILLARVPFRVNSSKFGIAWQRNSEFQPQKKGARYKKLHSSSGV